jgi:hypothetical protein
MADSNPNPNFNAWTTCYNNHPDLDIYEILNAGDPKPLFATKCRKHEKAIYFSFGPYEERTLEEAARYALTTCDECKAEVVLPPTRWPEGAEL